MINVSLAARHYVCNETSMQQLLERSWQLIDLQKAWNSGSSQFKYFTSLTCQFSPQYWNDAEAVKQYLKVSKDLEAGFVNPFFLLNDGSIGAGTTYMDRLFNDAKYPIRVQLDVDAVDFENPIVKNAVERAATQMIADDVPFGVLMKGNIKKLHSDDYLNFKRLAYECLLARHAEKRPYSSNNPFNVPVDAVPPFFVDYGDHFSGLNISNSESSAFNMVKEVVNNIVAISPGFLIEYYTSIFVKSKLGLVIPVRLDDFDIKREPPQIDRLLANDFQSLLKTDLKEELAEDILSGTASKELIEMQLSCNSQARELQQKAVLDLVELLTPIAQQN